MEEISKPIRLGCFVAVLSLFAGVACFYLWIRSEFAPVTEGKEYPPLEQTPWLKQSLESDFHWSGLQEQSVERVWANGFQDHTWLFRIRLSPDKFAELHRAVLASKAEGAQIDDRDDLAVCPRAFGTLKPRGPSDMKVPDWWEVASLRSFDGLLWRFKGDGYWFAYDREKEILFLLRYNG